LILFLLFTVKTGQERDKDRIAVMAWRDVSRQVSRLEASNIVTLLLRTRSQNAAAAPNLALDLPGSLSTHVLNALKADPRTVELRALAPHFYALASRILELFEEDELVDVLGDVRLDKAFIWGSSVLIWLK
jgi:hypothetical protein